MKTRNLCLKQSLARIYSVRALTLALALSLTAVGSVSASAIDACAVSPTDAGCLINTASSKQVVVNKTRALSPSTYRPSDLITVPKYNPYGRILRREVSASVVRLGNAMKSAGKGTLIVQSGYRSYSSQKTIHKAKVRALGKTKGEKLAARPGYSEHQTGLAVDFAARGVSTLQVSFAKTKAGKWLAANAYRYGFVLRYPSGKTAITGYSFEPWHFRYVGVDLATAMHDQSITTLEEYFALPAAPNYLN
jgi:D-alanyl-D-alanine carboxypeptidase